MQSFRSPVRLLVALGLAVLVPAQTVFAAAPAGRAYDQTRLLAGHLLRRAGFGPSPTDMKDVLKVGPTAWIEKQLQPSRIDDSVAEAKLPREPDREHERYADEWLRRWYTRIVYSRRQLQEKMTLVWHQHFATSNAKVRDGLFMHNQEEMLRRNALGSFRQMLVDVTVDNAMLVWLDNDPNNGQAYDDQGNPIPPNENYAREFLQLFALGPVRLRMDGTPVLDAQGQPVPNYTETDVREVARAFTGWSAEYRRARASVFYPSEHDPHDKTILGTRVVGREGPDGALEVQDVVDVVLSQQSVAPFIAKELIQQLATETPTPGYVERVATAFKNSNYDIRSAVRAIFTDAEFSSDAVVRSQFKTPVEHFAGVVRALGGKTQGASFLYWLERARHELYYPPSVFAFYRPGQKRTLVNTALALVRDSIGDELTNGYVDRNGRDTAFDARKLIKKNRLKTPEQAVDFLCDALLAAPMTPAARQIVVGYMEGRVDETKFRGAVWLIVCSPDFQRN
jgi:uncharacterized protein (DUF1800 family)